MNAYEANCRPAWSQQMSQRMQRGTPCMAEERPRLDNPGEVISDYVRQLLMNENKSTTRQSKKQFKTEKTDQ